MSHSSAFKYFWNYVILLKTAEKSTSRSDKKCSIADLIRSCDGIRAYTYQHTKLI